MDAEEAGKLCMQAACMASGTGCPKDPEGAVAIFRAVADSGRAEGYFGLAELTAAGNGVPRDEDAAVSLYEKARSLGSVPAAYRLAHYYWEGPREDLPRCFECLRQCCDAEFAPAYDGMGDACYYGRGTPADPAEAAVWYRKGADSGNAVCLFKLGCMHESGIGVDKDRVAAEKCFLRAAEAGLSEAQFRMAALEYDKGTPEGKKAAAGWYRACSGEYSVAEFNLACMMLSGEGTDKDPAGAYRIFLGLAGKGDADAMFQAGRMLIDGVGVEQNAEEGFRWMGKAARAGSPEAKQLVEGLRRAQNAQLIHIDGDKTDNGRR